MAKKRYVQAVATFYLPVDSEASEKIDARDGRDLFMQVTNYAASIGVVWEKAKFATRGGRGYEMEPRS